jgi:hypothetical protein
VQTILWGQPASEAGVLSDPCRGDVLHGSEVYLTGMGTRSSSALEGFLVIKYIYIYIYIYIYNLLKVF